MAATTTTTAAAVGIHVELASSSGGTNLTIYSSLPLQGDSRPQSVSVNNGEQLALEKAGNKAGKFTITFKKLDDATAAAGKWDPGATSGDARKAAQDKSTIAYLGEFNSGATAISLPILNEAGILQVSPSNTAVGLTRSQGADKGEPDKYYPSGKRTYGRVVPADHIQAAAQVTYQKDNGCTQAVHPERQGGLREGPRRPGRRRSPRRQGITVLGNEGIDPKAANYRALAGHDQGQGR